MWYFFDPYFIILANEIDGAKKIVDGITINKHARVQRLDFFS